MMTARRADGVRQSARRGPHAQGRHRIGDREDAHPAHPEIDGVGREEREHHAVAEPEGGAERHGQTGRRHEAAQQPRQPLGLARRAAAPAAAGGAPRSRPPGAAGRRGEEQPAEARRPTRSSPRAGPTAPETSPEIPKIPSAWLRRSGGTRSTTTVKFAMKKTEKATPWSARSSGKRPSALGATANRSATTDVSTAPSQRNARRPPRSTQAPTIGWTTIAVAL